MARHGRNLLAGMAVHVMQRGNNRETTFWRTRDREHYLHLLWRFAPRSGCQIHAYCLMTNHVHLLLTPAASDSCTRLMKDLGQNYAQYANRIHGRTGSLWEGRFKSCPVDSNVYVQRCQRYIELNPVRAGLASDPGDYPWSSYHFRAEGKASSIVVPHSTYLGLGDDELTRQRAYQSLVRQPLEDTVISQIREATQGGFALAGPDFQRKLAAVLGRRVAKGMPGRPPKGDAGADDPRQSELPI